MNTPYQQLKERLTQIYTDQPPSMTSDEINKRLGDEELADLGTIITKGLEGTDKAVAYIGWAWRDVDFDEPLSLGVIPGEWIGFMENNKWGYDYVHLTAGECATIRGLVTNYVISPSNDTAQSLFDFMQRLIAH